MSDSGAFEIWKNNVLIMERDMLKSVLSAERCAKCRICCSFVEDDVWEAPTLTNPQTKEKYRVNYSFADKNEIKLCPELDEKKGCTLGENKPFECRLWPLRPFIIDGEVKIGVSEICPAFTTENDGKLAELLDGGLYDTILKELQTNPGIVREYSGGYRIIR